MERINLLEPDLRGNEINYLNQCISSRFVSTIGPLVTQFEQRFAEFTQSKYAIACCSGTAALHTAMRILDIDLGDEVFVSTVSFAASANAILYQRGIPVFVDSNKNDWNLDVDIVLEEISTRHRLGQKQPKAIEVVHLLGTPVNLNELKNQCDRFGIFMIEDAAESFGAYYQNHLFNQQHVGTLGTVGCFSFNGNKIITTGGGGMITTQDPQLAKRAKHLTTQARETGAALFHDDIGYNYRMINPAAAIGLAQLERFQAIHAQKEQIFHRYNQAFLDHPRIRLRNPPPHVSSANWLFAAEFIHSAAIANALQKNNIETRPIWRPLHTMPIYAKFPRLGEHVAENIFEHVLCLPSSTTLDPVQQNRIIELIHSVA